MRIWVWSLPLLSGLRIQHCHELQWRMQTRLGSTLRWLWYRPAAAAPIQPLVWELGTSICWGRSPKKTKEKKNNMAEHAILSSSIPNPTYSEPHVFLLSPFVDFRKCSVSTKGICVCVYHDVVEFFIFKHIKRLSIRLHSKHSDQIRAISLILKVSTVRHTQSSKQTLTHMESRHMVKGIWYTNVFPSSSWILSFCPWHSKLM